MSWWFRTFVHTWHWGLLRVAGTFSNSACSSQSLCRQPDVSQRPLYCPPGQGRLLGREAASPTCRWRDAGYSRTFWLFWGIQVCSIGKGHDVLFFIWNKKLWVMRILFSKNKWLILRGLCSFYNRSITTQLVTSYNQLRHIIICIFISITIVVVQDNTRCLLRTLETSLHVKKTGKNFLKPPLNESTASGNELGWR